MAVLTEAISVVVRGDAIAARYPGGWEAFRDAAPNETLCADGTLARLGFMSPEDAREFVRRLVAAGLAFEEDGPADDLVVVDQLQGPTTPCDWIEWGHVEIGPGRDQRVAAARLVGDDRSVVCLPPGWAFDGSLSQSPGFVPDREMARRMFLLAREDGLESWLDLDTGREMYVGRTGKGAEG